MGQSRDLCDQLCLGRLDGALFSARQGVEVFERVALNRVHPIERNRTIPGLCWYWIVFNLNQIEGNPL
jgi:hypothetical protein